MDGWICPEIDKKATGKRIRRRMNVMGISVKDIQSYLGLSCVQSVYHWLEGMSMPTVDNMYALSELLQVSIDTLLTGNRSLANNAAANTPLEEMKAENIILSGRYDKNSATAFWDLTENEYTRIRERGQYVNKKYKNTIFGFEGDMNTIQAAINSNDSVGIETGTNGYWRQRQVAGNGYTNSDIVERISANVKASADMIKELDTFMSKGTYIDPFGNTVQVKNLTPFSYKTPNNVTNWGDMQDPLTFYFYNSVNEETYDAIATITGRHAREKVFDANPNHEWISNVEKNPTKDNVAGLAQEIEPFSKTLADNLKLEFIGKTRQSTRKNLKYLEYYFANNTNGQISLGRYTAYKNLLVYLRNEANGK